MTQIFFDKRGFQKLEKIWKNSYVFGQIDKSILAVNKVTLPVVWLNNYFFTNFLITFGNY